MAKRIVNFFTLERFFLADWTNFCHIVRKRGKYI